MLGIQIWYQLPMNLVQLEVRLLEHDAGKNFGQDALSQCPSLVASSSQPEVGDPGLLSCLPHFLASP